MPKENRNSLHFHNLANFMYEVRKNQIKLKNEELRILFWQEFIKCILIFHYLIKTPDFDSAQSSELVFKLTSWN